jgi:tRNA threonylcarbamoyladenosine biosynthesis protein TsaE
MEVAQTLLSQIDSGVVVLQGDLAAGKTTLVQAIALTLGVKEGVTSPTFSLQQCYDNRLFHYDIYNQGLDQFMGLGLFEELEKEGLHLIEWGDNQLVDLLSQAGFTLLKVEISKEHEKRCYTMTKIG